MSSLINEHSPSITSSESKLVDNNKAILSKNDIKIENYEPRMCKSAPDDLISGILAAQEIQKKLSSLDRDAHPINTRMVLVSFDNFMDNVPNENGEIELGGIPIEASGGYAARFFKKSDIKDFNPYPQDIYLSLDDIRKRERWKTTSPKLCIELLLSENEKGNLEVIHPETYYTDVNNSEYHFGRAARELIKNHQALYRQSDIETLEEKYFATSQSINKTKDKITLKDECKRCFPKLLEQRYLKKGIPHNKKTKAPNHALIATDLYYVIKDENKCDVGSKLHHTTIENIKRYLREREFEEQLESLEKESNQKAFK